MKMLHVGSLYDKGQMWRQLSLTTRRELIAALRVRYTEADRESKRAILDEFVKVSGHHRKHVIRLLNYKGWPSQGSCYRRSAIWRRNNAGADRVVGSVGQDLW